jgi:acyl carrier protein
MSSVPWPASFENILRSYLTLAEGEELVETMNPVDYGLDSMATVGLLLDLEGEYAITIPDDQLAELASADIGTLWMILQKAGASTENTLTAETAT